MNLLEPYIFQMQRKYRCSTKTTWPAFRFMFNLDEKIAQAIFRSTLEKCRDLLDVEAFCDMRKSQESIKKHLHFNSLFPK